ncbi:MAG: 4Fe-4S ferredoxin [Euryarchaeota archaeon RBG_16_62_10]|nr:MAG: 4Fe-4S ferredoxin [Euryarchaeota archaeon RBG_16_62_10]
MDRQAKRRLAIYVSLALFPATFYYMSPILIIMGAYEGLVVGSALTFAAMFLLSLYLGRAFCGWACPMAGLQEACARKRNRRVEGRKKDMIKYAIWAPWMAIIVLTALIGEGIHDASPLYQTVAGISILGTGAPFTLLIFVGIVVAVALGVGQRAFCHCGCWMAPFMVFGTSARDRLGLPGLRIVSDKSKCTSCKKCTKNCSMSLDVNAMVQKGSMRNSECVLCGTCADGCPKGAIVFSFGRAS